MYNGQTLVSFTVMLNSNLKWSVSPTSGCYDIQTITQHELGHALGVAHCHESTDTKPCFSTTRSSNIMCPNIAIDTLGSSRRTFQPYDTSSYIVIYQ